MLPIVVAVLGVYATLKLGDEFRRLLFESGASGAIDLRVLRSQTHAWFGGQPVYGGPNFAPYPPASFVILFPFVGWLDELGVRWLWGLTSVVVLGWLASSVIRASTASTRLERAFVALMLLAMNATGVVIGNGQLTLHTLAVLLAGLLLLRDAGDWRRDLLAGGLIALALVKPNISAPFLWLVVLGPHRVRTLAIVSTGAVYVGLTSIALSFQPAGVVGVFSALWSQGATFEGHWSYANLTHGLATLGLTDWALPATSGVFGLLGVWVYGHRRARFWTLVGVSALVARLGIYHLVYDDVLMFLPMVALFEIARQEGQQDRGVLAGVLLAINVIVMLFLARWQFAPAPLSWLFVWGHALTWIADLVFLARCAAPGMGIWLGDCGGALDARRVNGAR